MEKIKWTPEEREERKKVLANRRLVLFEVQRRVLENASRVGRYIYEPTADYLFQQMSGERLQRTYRRRQDLRQRIFEDFRISNMIIKMVNKTLQEEKEMQ